MTKIFSLLLLPYENKNINVDIIGVSVFIEFESNFIQNPLFFMSF